MENLTEKQADEMTNRNYDLLMGYLCPWGSLDVWNMVKTAEEVDMDMLTLSEVLQDQAEQMGINLFEDGTDVNALLNDYILNEARNEIENLTNIDIVNDYDVYYFANYLDCPLQYSTECQEAIEEAIKENELSIGDFNIYSLYVLDEMNVNFDYKED